MWGKLEVKNNRGHLTYFVNDKEIKPGETMDLRFPDGTIKYAVELKGTKHSDQMSDHGHPYYYTYTILRVPLNVYGIPVDMDARDLKGLEFWVAEAL